MRILLPSSITWVFTSPERIYSYHVTWTFFLSFLITVCVWVFSLHVYICTMCMPGAQRGQKRAPDPLTLELDSCEQPCGGWELNCGSLQKHQVLLTTKPLSSPDEPLLLLSEQPPLQLWNPTGFASTRLFLKLLCQCFLIFISCQEDAKHRLLFKCGNTLCGCNTLTLETKPKILFLDLTLHSNIAHKNFQYFLLHSSYFLKIFFLFSFEMKVLEFSM